MGKKEECSEFDKARDKIKAYIMDNALLPRLMVEAQFTSRTTFYNRYKYSVCDIVIPCYGAKFYYRHKSIKKNMASSAS